MGPPPFDGGNAGAHPLLPLTSERFNGATAFRRWKLRERAGWGRGSAKLQWGHRLSTVETSCARLYTVLPVPASMGPPPFDGGNIVIDVGVVNDPVASMGPPPFDGGNICTGCFMGWRSKASMGPPPFDGGNAACRRPTSRGWVTLQWGHRLSTVETCLPCE